MPQWIEVRQGDETMTFNTDYIVGISNTENPEKTLVLIEHLSYSHIIVDEAYEEMKNKIAGRRAKTKYTEE